MDYSGDSYRARDPVPGTWAADGVSRPNIITDPADIGVAAGDDKKREGSQGQINEQLTIGTVQPTSALS